MKSRHLLTATLILALSGAAVPALAQFAPPELAIHHVRDNIYMIRSAASGNITVLTSDDGVLLIDSKFAREYDGYMELLRTVTDQPIRYVINTHMHGDHSEGNTRLAQFGPEIIATANARTRMAESIDVGLPNFTFEDHVRLYFGGQPLDLYYFGRGHTDGDLVIHLPEQRLILPGDLFAGYGPSLRLIDYNGGGSLFEWDDTLRKAMALDFDTVIPGHSDVTDRAMMQESLDEVVRMQNMIREMHDAGRAPADIQTAITGEFGNMSFVVLPGIENVLAELE